MNVLVTGAAGYIGSIVTEELVSEGNIVIALDNLHQGHREAVGPEAVFVQDDLGDVEALDHIFSRYQIEAVMHLAAVSIVEQSMTDPNSYFYNNISCGINLLDAMLKHKVECLVFSSSAAVYGEPKTTPIDEEHSLLPVNAYGETKLMFERILYWYRKAYGLKSVSLRYFNAAGASDRYGEHHEPETHLIPKVLQVALGQEDSIRVFGTDYDTKDGSCIRDYVHILDIASAHILALQHLDSQGVKSYNLGSGKGYSVLEVIETARRITGAEIPYQELPRRPGDPATLVASSDLARSELGWVPKYGDLEVIIETAWFWQKEHPNGYQS
jgi:UDP-glucose 4-epimerase